MNPCVMIEVDCMAEDLDAIMDRLTEVAEGLTDLPGIVSVTSSFGDRVWIGE